MIPYYNDLKQYKTVSTGTNLSILKQPVLSVVNDHLIAYPVPSNLNYFWGFGSLAGLSLVIQIATGVFLACHYTPDVNLAFSSVEHIMRDVQGGFLLRYMHANGASMFFVVTFAHMLRSLYYGSYQAPREGGLDHWGVDFIFNDCNSIHGRANLRPMAYRNSLLQ